MVPSGTCPRFSTGDDFMAITLVDRVITMPLICVELQAFGEVHGAE